MTTLEDLYYGNISPPTTVSETIKTETPAETAKDTGRMLAARSTPIWRSSSASTYMRKRRKPHANAETISKFTTPSNQNLAQPPRRRYLQ